MRPDAIAGLATQGHVSLAEQRSTDVERAALYASVMGVPGGSADAAKPNREFQDLWLRFVSAVSMSTRQPHLADFAERAAQSLADAAGPRIDQARRDSWQVIDDVASHELGGATNTARYRSLATAGGAILEKLAAFNGLTNDPSLAQASERWLAVNGARDEDVEAMSQPDAARAQVDAWSRALFDAVGASAASLRATAVFAGPSGTGKTLAAHLLGSAAGVNVHRVDLSAVVSKYIGETEKNLDRVFGAARDAGALLLFDEADALLGKRTEVKDAHDRYANVAVAGLVERLNTFDGVAVIATQQEPASIDPRLLERVDARLVRFPLPAR